MILTPMKEARFDKTEFMRMLGLGEGTELLSIIILAFEDGVVVRFKYTEGT